MVEQLVPVVHAEEATTRAFVEDVVRFVDRHSELSVAVVGRLLEGRGIRGKFRGKQHAVRKLLVDRKVIIKHKNYVSDAASGLRHATFYFLGPGVGFLEAHGRASPTPLPPVPTSYPSVVADENAVVRRQSERQAACQQRFLDCRRQRKRAAAHRTPDGWDDEAVAKMMREEFAACFPA